MTCRANVLNRSLGKNDSENNVKVGAFVRPFKKSFSAPYLDPQDERAGKTPRLTVYPLPDRNQTTGNFPATNRHFVYWPRSTPNCLYALTSVLQLSNPRFAVAFLRPARARWRYSQDG